MNLLSFYTVAAVIFDTFIVRALVVPALFSIMPDLDCKWNWRRFICCRSLSAGGRDRISSAVSFEEVEGEDEDVRLNDAF